MSVVSAGLFNDVFEGIFIIFHRISWLFHRFGARYRERRSRLPCGPLGFAGLPKSFRAMTLARGGCQGLRAKLGTSQKALFQGFWSLSMLVCLSGYEPEPL